MKIWRLFVCVALALTMVAAGSATIKVSSAIIMLAWMTLMKVIHIIPPLSGFVG